MNKRKTYSVTWHDDCICVAEFHSYAEAEQFYADDEDYRIVTKRELRESQKMNEGCYFIETEDEPFPVLLIKGEVVAPRRSIAKKARFKIW